MQPLRSRSVEFLPGLDFGDGAAIGIEAGIRKVRSANDLEEISNQIPATHSHLENGIPSTDLSLRFNSRRTTRDIYSYLEQLVLRTTYVRKEMLINLLGRLANRHVAAIPSLKNLLLQEDDQHIRNILLTKFDALLSVTDRFIAGSADGTVTVSNETIKTVFRELTCENVLKLKSVRDDVLTLILRKACSGNTKLMLLLAKACFSSRTVSGYVCNNIEFLIRALKKHSSNELFCEAVRTVTVRSYINGTISNQALLKRTLVSEFIPDDYLNEFNLNLLRILGKVTLASPEDKDFKKTFRSFCLEYFNFAKQNKSKITLNAQKALLKSVKNLIEAYYGINAEAESYYEIEFDDSFILHFELHFAEELIVNLLTELSQSTFNSVKKKVRKFIATLMKQGMSDTRPDLVHLGLQTVISISELKIYAPSSWSISCFERWQGLIFSQITSSRDINERHLIAFQALAKLVLYGDSLIRSLMLFRLKELLRNQPLTTKYHVLKFLSQLVELGVEKGKNEVVADINEALFDSVDAIIRIGRELIRESMDSVALSVPAEEEKANINSVSQYGRRQNRYEIDFICLVLRFISENSPKGNQKTTASLALEEFHDI